MALGTSCKRKWRAVLQKVKGLKTRNKMLLLVSVFVIVYTIVDIVLGFLSIKNNSMFQLDSTLTSEVFSFAKWVVVSGAGITVAKTIKGSTNNDETEEPMG